MIKARFKTNPVDYRPVNWPIKHPYWCTGMEGDGSAYIIVAYVDNVEEIMANWPDATNIDIFQENVTEYDFYDRMPQPSWFDPQKQAAKVELAKAFNKMVDDFDEEDSGYDPYFVDDPKEKALIKNLMSMVFSLGVIPMPTLTTVDGEIYVHIRKDKTHITIYFYDEEMFTINIWDGSDYQLINGQKDRTYAFSDLDEKLFRELFQKVIE